MKTFEETTKELAEIMLGMDLDEVAGVTEKWIGQLTADGCNQKVVAYCWKLAALVIEAKEKVGAAT